MVGVPLLVIILEGDHRYALLRRSCAEIAHAGEARIRVGADAIAVAASKEVDRPCSSLVLMSYNLAVPAWYLEEVVGTSANISGITAAARM